MSDKDVADKAKEVDKTEDFEKRYKDSQTHITTIEQENKDLRDAAGKDKDLFDAVSPYIDWDAVNGKAKTATDVIDDDGYVDRKTLKKTTEDLRAAMARMEATNNFRSKYPDMREYEDLVGVYFQKTDPRRSQEERIAKAVENVKTLIASERTKGREDSEKEKKEKTKKEADVSGLSESKVPEGKTKESEGETYDEVIANRKARLANAMTP